MTGAMMVAVAKVSRAQDSAHAQRIADGVISVLSRLVALSAHGARPAAAGLVR
jgi:hypothetical protein